MGTEVQPVSKDSRGQSVCSGSPALGDQRVCGFDPRQHNSGQRISFFSKKDVIGLVVHEHVW